jgi:hypothetical protein
MPRGFVASRDPRRRRFDYVAAAVVDACVALDERRAVKALIRIGEVA